MQKTIQEYYITTEKDLDEILFDVVAWDRIFFSWDLWVWKSTFIRHIIRKYMDNPGLVVRSPTYTYYQKYRKDNTDITIYHCDLYRLEDYNTWISIWGEEIAMDPNGIFLIEWPEILENTIIPNKKISIEIMENNDRKITIESYII